MAKVDVGDAAPDFELPGTGDRTYRLADYRGRKVVLAFYPGADVLGISTQSVDSHERFVKEKSLNVPLLADEDKEVARAYGVLAGPMVRRAIFVIDEEGIIRHRKVTLVGLTFETVEDLEQAVTAAG
jgi:peroxiredoxin Q/BCP